ncbi:hypothetical protein A2U01_0096928, partial [Trifolium medium]|nr:hypothetical protein [Trifolium medium]
MKLESSTLQTESPDVQINYKTGPKEKNALQTR